MNQFRLVIVSIFSLVLLQADKLNTTFGGESGLSLSPKVGIFKINPNFGVSYGGLGVNLGLAYYADLYGGGEDDDISPYENEVEDNFIFHTANLNYKHIFSFNSVVDITAGRYGISQDWIKKYAQGGAVKWNRGRLKLQAGAFQSIAHASDDEAFDFMEVPTSYYAHLSYKPKYIVGLKVQPYFLGASEDEDGDMDVDTRDVDDDNDDNDDDDDDEVSLDKSNVVGLRLDYKKSWFNINTDYLYDISNSDKGLFKGELGFRLGNDFRLSGGYVHTKSIEGTLASLHNEWYTDYEDDSNIYYGLLEYKWSKYYIDNVTLYYVMTKEDDEDESLYGVDIDYSYAQSIGGTLSYEREEDDNKFFAELEYRVGGDDDDDD